MNNDSILLSKENGIAIITMNRADIMNPLTDELAAGLLEAFKDVRDDEEIGAVILTGSGMAFCAGGDLNRLKEGFASAQEGYEYMKSFQEMLLTFMNMPKPTIAAVNGYAVGAGFCIAMQADIILSSSKAKYGMAFANVGLVPDLAGMYTLPRLAGLTRAKELIFTGRTIDAQEAYDMGIINRIIEPEQLMAEAQNLAASLAAGPRVALRMAKSIINKSVDISLEQLLSMEPLAQSMCFESSDHKEGVNAFFEKRRPEFTGR